MSTRRSAHMICAAATRLALPVVGLSWLISPTPAIAAPQLSVSFQGTATDSAGHTAVGWVGVLLTLNADAGQVFTAIDLSSTETLSQGHGIFATMLQDWIPGKNAIPTPVGASSTDTNGDLDGTDSHLLPTNRLDVQGGPFEDNDLVHPAGAPANDESNIWGSGSALHGVFGLPPAAETNIVPLAYLVIPAGGSGSYSIDVAEAVPGTASTAYHLESTFNSLAIPEPGSSALLLCTLLTAGAGPRRGRHARATVSSEK